MTNSKTQNEDKTDLGEAMSLLPVLSLVPENFPWSL